MSSIETMPLYGGRLCLDFVNTIHDRFEEPQRDYLKNIGDLMDWVRKTEVLDGAYSQLLAESVESNPARTKAFFDRTIDLRELLYSIFLAISHNQKVDKKDLAGFNALLPQTLSKLEIGQKRMVFSPQWIAGTLDLTRIAWPIIKDAYDLLLLNESGRIKECPKCGWLFFDSSKNGRRKWCSMETCGSRAKATDWYHRQKK